MPDAITARKREFRRGYAEGWLAAVEELTAVLADAAGRPPASVRAAYKAAWRFRRGPLATWAAGAGEELERAPWLAEPWRPLLREADERRA